MTTRTYLSWSEVSTWLNCQLAWQWHYGEGLAAQGAGSIEQQMGSAAHLMFRRYYSAPPPRRNKTLMDEAIQDAFNGLVLGEYEKPAMRWAQLVSMGQRIVNTWGQDDEFPQMVTETAIEAPVPWDNVKGYLCIPDAFAVVNGGNTGVILSHKTRLSQLPLEHILTHYHQQARLEAWALKEVYGVKSVEIYLNMLTPSQAQREGPFLYTSSDHEYTGQELERMFLQVGKVPWIARPGPHCFGCEYKRLHDVVAEGGDMESAKEDYRD